MSQSYPWRRLVYRKCDSWPTPWSWWRLSESSTWRQSGRWWRNVWPYCCPDPSRCSLASPSSSLLLLILLLQQQLLSSLLALPPSFRRCDCCSCSYGRSRRNSFVAIAGCWRQSSHSWRLSSARRWNWPRGRRQPSTANRAGNARGCAEAYTRRCRRRIAYPWKREAPPGRDRLTKWPPARTRHGASSTMADDRVEWPPGSSRLIPWPRWRRRPHTTASRWLQLLCTTNCPSTSTHDGCIGRDTVHREMLPTTGRYPSRSQPLKHKTASSVCDTRINSTKEFRPSGFHCVDNVQRRLFWKKERTYKLQSVSF